jgi:hypothetical protein
MSKLLKLKSQSQKDENDLLFLSIKLMRVRVIYKETEENRNIKKKLLPKESWFSRPVAFVTLILVMREGGLTQKHF